MSFTVTKIQPAHLPRLLIFNNSSKGALSFKSPWCNMELALGRQRLLHKCAHLTSSNNHFFTRCLLNGEFLAPGIATEIFRDCAQWYLLGIAFTIKFLPLIYLQAMEILLQVKFDWYNCSTTANWASVFLCKRKACGSEELGSSFWFYIAASTDTQRVSREGHARITLHPSFSWREISRNLLIPDVVTS